MVLASDEVLDELQVDECDPVAFALGGVERGGIRAAEGVAQRGHGMCEVVEGLIPDQVAVDEASALVLDGGEVVDVRRDAPA